MAFQLQQINKRLEDIITEQWSKQLSSLPEDFPSESYHMSLYWISTKNTASRHTVSYVLIDTDKNEMLAIMDLTHAHPKTKDSYIKAIDIRVQPKDSPYFLDQESNRFSNILQNIIFELLKLSDTSMPANMIKIYGVNLEARRFLNLLHEQVTVVDNRMADMNIVTKAYASWLEIRKTPNVENVAETTQHLALV